MKDLILWRHAEAEDASKTGTDADRMLTRRGRKDAVKMAGWLKEHLPADTLVISSPACRCKETAAALAEISDFHITTADFLGVDSTVEEILGELALIDGAKTILVIGHQPNLGYLIATMLKMDDRACVVKKGAVWWLRRRPAAEDKQAALQTYLFTVQHPDCV